MSFSMENPQNTQTQQYQTQTLNLNMGSMSNTTPQYGTIQLGPPPFYEPIFMSMLPRGASVPPTPASNVPFKFDQLNIEHDTQPQLTH